MMNHKNREGHQLSPGIIIFSVCMIFALIVLFCEGKIVQPGIIKSLISEQPALSSEPLRDNTIIFDGISKEKFGRYVESCKACGFTNGVVSNARLFSASNKTGRRLIARWEQNGSLHIRINALILSDVYADKDVLPAGSTFEVYFIDVGQADSALVLCDGKAMLIDGGNAADSDLIYSYLKKLSVSHLDYIVCTHAHEDHVGGLAGALNYATVDHALCPATSYNSKAFGNFVKYLEKRGVSIETPKAGDTFELGSANVMVLGPISSTDETNNTSIVLRIVYGDTSFLFAGDAERDEEQDILSAGYSLESTVLKVGHHGSDTSTSYPFLREIMPKYAVISVGKNNSYGHPAQEVLSRLRDADVKVFRTDLQGDIICKSDGKTVTFAVEKRNAGTG